MNEREQPFIFEAELAKLPIQYPGYTASLQGIDTSRLIDYARQYPASALEVFYPECKIVPVGKVAFTDSAPLLSKGYSEEMPSCTGISMLDEQGRAGLSHTAPNKDPRRDLETMLHHFENSQSIYTILVGTNAEQIEKIETILRAKGKSSFLQMHVITDIREEGLIEMGINPANRSIIMDRLHYQSYELPF